MNFIIAGQRFECIVRYRQRRTIELKLLNSQQLQLSVPLSCQLTEVEAFVKKHSKWILNTQQKLLTHEQAAQRYLVAAGAIVPFMGKDYSLQVRYDGSDSTLKLTTDSLIVTLSVDVRDNCQPYLTKILYDWYGNHAAAMLYKQTQLWSTNIGVSPRKICIRDSKTRWGSCSNLGNINYSWRIILTPLNVIEYLVVHELCHLKELNHSSRFWQLVESNLPEYKQSKQWLKQHGSILMDFMINR